MMLIGTHYNPNCNCKNCMNNNKKQIGEPRDTKKEGCCDNCYHGCLDTKTAQESGHCYNKDCPCHLPRPKECRCACHENKLNKQRESIIAKNKPEIEKANKYIKDLEEKLKNQREEIVKELYKIAENSEMGDLRKDIRKLIQKLK